MVADLIRLFVDDLLKPPIGDSYSEPLPLQGSGFRVLGLIEMWGVMLYGVLGAVYVGLEAPVRSVLQFHWFWAFYCATPNPKPSPKPITYTFGSKQSSTPFRV